MDIERILTLSDMINGLLNALEIVLNVIYSDGIGTSDEETLFSLFYILSEKADELHNNVFKLSEEIQMCDAIAAVNHVERLKAENEQLKQALKEANNTVNN